MRRAARPPTATAPEGARTISPMGRRRLPAKGDARGRDEAPGNRGRRQPRNRTDRPAPGDRPRLRKRVGDQGPALVAPALPRSPDAAGLDPRGLEEPERHHAERRARLAEHPQERRRVPDRERALPVGDAGAFPPRPPRGGGGARARRSGFPPRRPRGGGGVIPPRGGGGAFARRSGFPPRRPRGNGGGF